MDQFQDRMKIKIRNSITLTNLYFQHGFSHKENFYKKKTSKYVIFLLFIKNKTKKTLLENQVGFKTANTKVFAWLD